MNKQVLKKVTNLEIRLPHRRSNLLIGCILSSLYDVFNWRIMVPTLRYFNSRDSRSSLVNWSLAWWHLLKRIFGFWRITRPQCSLKIGHGAMLPICRMRISGFGPRAIPFGTSNEEKEEEDSSVAISRFGSKNLMVYDVA